MSTETAKDLTKVITSKVRFSYVHAFEPTALGDDQEKKYSVSILIPKTEKALIEKLKKAIQAAKDAGKAKFGAAWKPKDPDPLKDGDVEKPEDPVYAGMMFVSAKGKNKPQVVDKNLDPIMDKEDFYSGCYGRASINFYAYEKGKGGVACGLNNLQKLEDGDRLGGISTAQDDFGEFSNDSVEDDIL